MRSLVLATTAILSVAVPCLDVRASICYAVDVSSDELRTVDLATGHVEVIGKLGDGPLYDFYDVDITTLNGELYATTYRLGEYADLYRLDTSTGEATRLARLTENGHYVGAAEAITNVNGTLHVAYGPDGGTRSTRIGTLSLTGEVVDLGPTPLSEFDAMAYRDGFTWGANANSPGTGSNELYTPYGMKYLNPPDTRIAGLEFDGDQLWGMSYHNSSLVQINTATGQIMTTIPLDMPGTYMDIAFIPEPASLSLLALAAATGMSRRR